LVDIEPLLLRIQSFERFYNKYNKNISIFYIYRSNSLDLYNILFDIKKYLTVYHMKKTKIKPHNTYQFSIILFTHCNSSKYSFIWAGVKTWNFLSYLITPTSMFVLSIWPILIIILYLRILLLKSLMQYELHLQSTCLLYIFFIKILWRSLHFYQLRLLSSYRMHLKDQFELNEVLLHHNQQLRQIHQKVCIHLLESFIGQVQKFICIKFVQPLVRNI